MRKNLIFSFPFYILSIVLMICSSCVDDETGMPDPISIPETTVTTNPYPTLTFEYGDTLFTDLERTQSIFPSELYQQNSKMLFKNALGHERLFTVTSVRDTIYVERNLSNGELANWYSEFIRFIFKEEQQANYQMQFWLVPDAKPIERTYDYGVLFGVFEPPLFDPSSDLNTIVWDFLNHRTYSPSGVDMTILGKTFQDVETREFIGNDGINKIYYTTDEGVVGLVDEFDLLFVFDSFQ